MQVKFDEVLIPEEKLNRVVAESMDEIYKGCKKKKSYQRFLYRIAVLIGIIILSGSLVISNASVLPVLAEKSSFFKKIFEKVQGESQYGGDYDKNAVQTDGITSETTEDLRFEFSEVVCTSQSMTYSIQITSQKGFPEEAMKESTNESDSEGKWMYLVGTQSADFLKDTIEEENTYDMPFIKGHYEDENTFIGTMRVDFNRYPFDGNEIPQHFIWSLKINSILYPNVETGVMEKLLTDGDLKFEFYVDRQNLGEKIVKVNKVSPSGWKITDITLTPYEMIVNEEYDEANTQKGYEQPDSIREIWTDADGRILHNKVGSFMIEGYNMSNVTVYYMPTPDEDSNTIIMEYIYQENHTDAEIQNYLEENCVSKQEISLE
ncbi:Uncharacterised protein [[Ruminococcus] torques]|uniref:DUF4179 domain-containing protein n=1 Tax=[Ruminococcus] torques TaxID=33039 RepID=A0A564TRG5_9FIRM|nr:hypothetical protein [[Ruminococcus] torques]VUX09834.1 Uncharacterised protein [[Ruminococcus] torques]